MRRVFLIVATCLFATNLVKQECVAQRADGKVHNMTLTTPQIEYTSESVEIPYGEKWNVSCKSNRPINWVLPELRYSYISSFVEYLTNDSDKMYGSILAINDASAWNVRRYYCIHKESNYKVKEHLNTTYMEGHFASIYVYVRDTKRQIVPVLTATFEIDRYDDFIVPCKPSYPDVELQLCNPLDGFCLKEYDPQKGFTIKADTFKVKTLQFICRAGTQSEKLTADLKYDDKVDNTTSTTPQIEHTSESVEIPYEKEWNVSCKSNRPINWVFPELRYAVDTSFVEYLTNDSNKMYGSVLAINYASAQEVGRYYCIHKESYYYDKEHLNTTYIEGHFASIYVYVRDTKRQIVPVQKKPFEIDRYDDFIVPCKPSYPDVELKLCNPLDGFCLKEYDPQKGFTIKADTFKVKTLQFICRAGTQSEKLTADLKYDDKVDNTTSTTPQIEYTSESVEIPYREEWNVSCKSNRPIIWVTPESRFHHVRFVKYLTNDSDKMYGSVLNINDASAQEVGRYYCIHKESNYKVKEHLNTTYMEGHFASIYVYVRDTDRQIVPVQKNTFEIDRYDGFIVPCKPSYPDVKLQLCNLFDGFCLTAYDPQKGFTIKADTFEVKVLQFICKTGSRTDRFTAQLKNDDEVHNTTLTTPQIEHTSEFVEIPYEEEWNVSCKSNRPINWVLPESRFAVHTSFMEYLTNDSDKMYGSILTINDASTWEVGRYYCIHKESYYYYKEHLNTTYMEGHFASIYVYVRDTNRQIVPVVKETFEIDQYDGFIVPCKPSYPDVKLQLCNPLDGFCLTEYDPQKGFTIQVNTFDVKIVQFICKSEFKSVKLTAQLKLDKEIDTSTFDAPIINYKNQPVLLPYGGSLNVTCMFNKPIRWVRYDFIHNAPPYYKKRSFVGPLLRELESFKRYEVKSDNVESIKYVTNEQTRKYGVILTITEASRKEIGRYYCVPQEPTHMDETYGKAIFASIFVYIGESFRGSMLVPGNSFEIDRYDDFIVPCRPSHPDVNVQLCNPLDESCLTDYDPEEGFKVTVHSFNIKILQFICKSDFDSIELTARFIDNDEADNITFVARHINYENQTVELPYGDNWNVSCVSNKPVRWIRHDPGYDWDSKDVKSTEHATNEPNRMYGAILIITSASAREVGRYYCIQKDSESNLKDNFTEMDRTGSIVSIYVYVRDIMQTIVPFPDKRITIDQQDHFIVPCKGSHPAVKVNLCNIDNDHCFASYDSQIGFTVQAGSFNTKYMDFNCSSTSSNKIVAAVNGRLENKQHVQFDYQLYFILPVLVILLLICLLISALNVKKMKEMKTLKAEELAAMLEGDLDNYSPTMMLNDQTDRLRYKTEYEFPREKITLHEQLGEGAFGVVMKGTAIGIVGNETQTTVAVKMVKKKYDIQALQALVAELKIMIHLGYHLNVVNMLGAVTKNIGKRELMVIVEYCAFGNLLNILRHNRARFIDEINQRTHSEVAIEPSTKSPAAILERSISSTDLICWAFQIAAGMDYLASRKVLHGDLAARNVLLSNDNVVKICDFGLSRSLYNGYNYKKNTQSPLPVRWLALECFSDGLFSTYSDVWAYGILIWELFSLGMIPYPGIEVNSDFYKMLRDGFRMEPPIFSNQEIYDIMLSCWRVRPDSRPSFKELKHLFNDMLSQELQDHYLALNEPYLAMNAARVDPWDSEYMPCLGSPESVAPLVPCSEGHSGEYMEMTKANKEFEVGGPQSLSTHEHLKQSSTIQPEYANVPVLKHQATPTGSESTSIH